MTCGIFYITVSCIEFSHQSKSISKCIWQHGKDVGCFLSYLRCNRRILDFSITSIHSSKSCFVSSFFASIFHSWLHFLITMFFSFKSLKTLLLNDLQYKFFIFLNVYLNKCWCLFVCFRELALGYISPSIKQKSHFEVIIIQVTDLRQSITSYIFSLFVFLYYRDSNKGICVRE